MELNSCASHIRTWVYMLHSAVFIKLPDEAHIVAKRIGEIKEVLIQLQGLVVLVFLKKTKKLKFNNRTVPN